MEFSKNIYEVILLNGLMEYKFKNSLYKPLNYIEEIKGSIFLFSSKASMISARGIVVTSVETVKEKNDYVTHWTPNIYCYGSYIDKSKLLTQGHREDNLKQINTFYVDFDSSTMTDSDILLTCFEFGFMPTVILKTERGYQAYFVLDKPVHVTKHTDYKVIEVAKKISKNIRKYLIKQGLPVDLACNHFGIARFPSDKNIVFYNNQHVYSFEKWIQWSLKQDEFLDYLPNQLSVIAGTSGIKQVDEPWFQMLLNQVGIKGKKNVLGRNNAIFTLALACFSSGLTEKECVNKLSSFNISMTNSLRDTEVKKIISSAYSERYEGASREYILHLCRTWINPDLTYKDLFSYQIWKKFKKPRANRIRSHYDEWEKDVLNYLDEQSRTNLYLKLTKKDISRAIKIPLRTLDVVLQLLQTKRMILFSSKKGRFGGINIALIKNVCIHIISNNKTHKQKYIQRLSKFLNLGSSIIEEVIDYFMEYKLYPSQTTLFDVDIGKMKGVS